MYGNRSLKNMQFLGPIKAVFIEYKTTTTTTTT
jgi:hypothetical protein